MLQNISNLRLPFHENLPEISSKSSSVDDVVMNHQAAILAVDLVVHGRELVAPDHARRGVPVRRGAVEEGGEVRQRGLPGVRGGHRVRALPEQGDVKFPALFLAPNLKGQTASFSFLCNRFSKVV